MSQESRINQGREPKGQKAAGLQNDSSCISKYSWSLTTLNYTANYYSLLIIFLMSVTGLAHPFAREAHAVSNKRNCPPEYVAMMGQYAGRVPEHFKGHLVAAECYTKLPKNPPVYMRPEEISELIAAVKEEVLASPHKKDLEQEFYKASDPAYSTVPAIQ